MKTEKIKLSYITEHGFMWLEVELSITQENYKSQINNYLETHNNLANALVEKWRMNGEDDVSLFPCIDNIDCDKDLYLIAYKYLESM